MLRLPRLPRRTPRSAAESWLVNTVHRLADQAGIRHPEVAIYDSPDVNAFATGPTRNNALVAVSTGLLSRLSEREVEILRLIAEGHSNDEIAQRIFLSVNTIKSHIRSAYRKLGVETRSQAVGWAYKNGLAGLPMDNEDADAYSTPPPQRVHAH